MMRAGVLLAVGGLCATLTACGGSPPPPPAASAPKPVAAAPAAPVPAPAPAGQPGAGPLVATPVVPQAAVSYDSKDRRDPFLPLDITSGGPKGLEVATTKLTGIVRSARTTLALVEAQDGVGYILKPGDTLGDGRLVEIGADAVVFTVSARPGTQSNRVVLKLAAN